MTDKSTWPYGADPEELVAGLVLAIIALGFLVGFVAGWYL